MRIRTATIAGPGFVPVVAPVRLLPVATCELEALLDDDDEKK